MVSASTPEPRPPAAGRGVGGKIASAILLAYIAATVVGAIAAQPVDLWPASYLMRLQARLFSGRYYVLATFTVTWLVYLSPLVAVGLLVDLWARLTRSRTKARS